MYWYSIVNNFTCIMKQKYSLYYYWKSAFWLWEEIEMWGEDDPIMLYLKVSVQLHDFYYSPWSVGRATEGMKPSCNEHMKYPDIALWMPFVNYIPWMYKYKVGKICIKEFTMIVKYEMRTYSKYTKKWREKDSIFT